MSKITLSKTSIQPIGDRVLVRLVEQEDEVRGGIVIPDSAKEKPQEAVVVALGTGKRDKSGAVIAFEVKAGDRVLLNKYGGTELKIGDVSHRLVSEDDILGILG